MILIVVQKPSVDARLGISLESDAANSGRVVVARVSRSGLFGKTPLRVGMEIVMVNDILCEGLQEVSRALKRAAAGTLTLHVIDAATTTSTVPSQTNKNAAIAAPPLAAIAASEPPDLESGAVEMLLGGSDGKTRVSLSQQGHQTRDTTTTTTTTSASSSYWSSGSRHPLTTIVVPHQAKLGLRLQQTEDHTAVAVKRIDPAGPFGNTDLRVGMRIVAVNDWECTGLDVDQVSAMFRQADREGLLTVLVQPEIVPDTTTEELQQRFQRYKSVKQTQLPSPSNNNNNTTTTNTNSNNAAMTAMVHTMIKSHPNQPTGIRLKETVDRNHVRIEYIQPHSLAATQTPQLAVDSVVRKINGESVRGWTVQQVAQAIRDTQGTLTIHTKMAIPTSSSSRQ
eukprot:scaffold6233_cov129-Amphora_coffeaeformis.AAC.3